MKISDLLNMNQKKNNTYGSKKRRFITHSNTFLFSNDDFCNIWDQEKEEPSPRSNSSLTGKYELKKRKLCINSNTKMGQINTLLIEETMHTDIKQGNEDLSCELDNERSSDQKIDPSKSRDIEPSNFGIIIPRISSHVKKGTLDQSYFEPKPKNFKDTYKLQEVEKSIKNPSKKKSLPTSFSDEPIVFSNTASKKSDNEEEDAHKTNKFNSFVSDSEKEAWSLFSNLSNGYPRKTNQILKNSVHISLNEEINENSDDLFMGPDQNTNDLDDKSKRKPSYKENENNFNSDEILDSDLTVCDEAEFREPNFICEQISQGFSNDMNIQDKDIFSVSSSSFHKPKKTKKDLKAKNLIKKTYDSCRSYLLEEIDVAKNHNEITDSAEDFETKKYSEYSGNNNLTSLKLTSDIKKVHTFDYLFKDISNAESVNSMRSVSIDLCFKIVKGNANGNMALLELYTSFNPIIDFEIKKLIELNDPLIIFCLLAIAYFLLSMQKFNIIKWLFGRKFGLMKTLIIGGLSNNEDGIIRTMENQKFKLSRISKMLLKELLEDIFSQLDYADSDMVQFLDKFNSLFFIFNITTGFERLTNRDLILPPGDFNDFLILIYDEEVVKGLLESCKNIILSLPRDQADLTIIDIDLIFMTSEAFLDLCIVETTDQISKISVVFNRAKPEISKIYSFALTFNDILCERLFIAIEKISKVKQIDLLIDSYVNFLQSLILISSKDNVQRFEEYIFIRNKGVISVERLFSILTFLSSMIESKIEAIKLKLARLQILILAFLFQISTHASHKPMFLNKANLVILKRVFTLISKPERSQTILTSRSYICLIIGSLLESNDGKDVLFSTFAESDLENMSLDLTELRSKFLEKSDAGQASIIINQIESALSTLSKMVQKV